jgi:alanyl-tRNA synthetase
LQSALREVFGDNLGQHGSNINEERLRFDFNLDRKMTPAEIAQVEKIVNEYIAKDLPVFWREYETQDALELGAIGPFGEKYGEKVKVYQMGGANSGKSTAQNFASLEICGGPHCERTGQLATAQDFAPDDSTDAPENANDTAPTDRAKMTRHFKIIKEESSSAGIRRIKAVLEATS